MSFARSALGLTRGVRNISTSVPKSSAGPVNPGYAKIKPKQEKMQVEDGAPVYIKGGAMDTLLYSVTMALCAGAVVWDFKLYWDLALK